MNVTVYKVTVRLPENQSLKGKRRVVNSLCARLRNKFNVSVAEVGDSRSWQLSTLGISHVSNSYRHANEVLDSVVSYIEKSRNDLELVDCERETLTGF